MNPKPLLVGLVLWTLLAYWPVRQASFVYEDDTYILPAQHALGAREAFAPRGLTALSFRLNALISGRDPRPYHATNLFLHLLVGLSVYALARRLLTPSWAALVAGLMLLHPLQTQASAYVAGRAEVIAALGTVWVVWALSAPVVTWRHLGVALVAAVVAVGGKELGIVALPLAALYALWFREWKWSWKGAGFVAAAGAIVLVLLVVVLRVRVFGNLYLAEAERGWLAYASIQSTALWTYMRIAVLRVMFAPLALFNIELPFQLIAQTVDHDFEQWARGLHLIGLAFGVGLTGLVLWFRRRSPVMTFGIAWVLLAVLPRFLVRQPEYLAEHQMYTPFIGLWIAFSAVTSLVYQSLRARALKDDVCVSPSLPSSPW